VLSHQHFGVRKVHPAEPTGLVLVFAADEMETRQEEFRRGLLGAELGRSIHG